MLISVPSRCRFSLDRFRLQQLDTQTSLSQQPQRRRGGVLRAAADLTVSFRIVVVAIFPEVVRVLSFVCGADYRQRCRYVSRSMVSAASMVLSPCL